MPTYEYACSACKHEWEFEQSIKDDPIKKCPACRKQTARRQISRGTGFILKGSGWYSDLYSGSSNSKGGSGGGSIESSTSSATTTESSKSSDAGSSDTSSASTPAPASKDTGSKGGPSTSGSGSAAA